MAAYKLDIFSGIRPRYPESLLPDRSATVAKNCDFAYGELRNTKDGFLLNTVTNVPRSIYTDDGVAFYTWTTDVNAVRSPLVADQYNRLYFTNGSSFQVTNRMGTKFNGGEPGTSFKVGVPKPTVAPQLAITLPSVTPDTANYEFRFHYELNGIKYQDQAIAATYYGSSKWRVTLPKIQSQVSYSTFEYFPETGVAGTVYYDKSTGNYYRWNGAEYVETTNDATPTEAKPVVRVTAKRKDNSATIFDLYSNDTQTTGLYNVTLGNDEGGGTYTVTVETGVKEADKETRAYVYTYVNTYNEEGPPSAPMTVTTGATVDVLVSVVKDNLTGYVPIKEIRVYRTPSGSAIADYFYVGSVSALTGGPGFQFVDNVGAGLLNEPISSTNYYPPPANLVGLMSLPNGILCAWKGNELWFSEAYKPWAWPPGYVKPLPFTIVGGIAHGSGAVVTTVQQPFIVSGVSPDSMTTAKLNVSQAGVSKWSIAAVDGTVIYASNDGLVVLNGNSASLMQSEKFFTRDVWRARYSSGLSSMVFSVWDGRLVVFSNTGAIVPFMIRMDEADGTMTVLPDLVASCAFISQLSDQFYYARNNGLYQFNGGTAQNAEWFSKEEVLTRPTNFGFAQAVVEGNWSIEFYAGGVLRHTKAVTTGVTDFRLPSGFKADRWKIRITGQGRFRELRIANTAAELARV